MFRRFLSLVLIVVLSASMTLPGFAEGSVSAGDLLFGGAQQPTVTPEPQAQTQPESQPTEQPESAQDEMYGENDQASITEYQTLQLGDSDAADGAAYIVMMQNRLIMLGFLHGSADGVFGADTETAVKQFQKLNGFEQTGIADPETQARLFSDIAALTTPSPENPIVYGSETVRIQTKLSEWGFMTGTVDGKLGKGSAKAIKAFKEYVYGLYPPPPTPTPEPTPEPTPIPTPEPGELPSVHDELLPTPVPSPTPFVASEEVDELLLTFVDGTREFKVYQYDVRNGDKNIEVKRVQTRLNQLKYLFPNADGAFGDSTELALKYFQRKHGLPETGVADEATQRKLFSGEVEKSDEYVYPYKIIVDISDQRVNVYKWDGSSFSERVKRMVCSTGKDATPTPTGTYQSYGRMTSDEWYYFKEFNCYAKWAYGIVGGILFHSVTFNANKVLNKGSVNNLGRKASHGCIRLEVEDAKWIHDNCPYGTTVVIQE